MFVQKRRSPSLWIIQQTSAVYIETTLHQRKKFSLFSNKTLNFDFNHKKGGLDLDLDAVSPENKNIKVSSLTGLTPETIRNK